MPEQQEAYQLSFFEDKDETERCQFKFPPSPRTDSEHLFQFPEAKVEEESPCGDKSKTCVTQNWIGTKMGSETKHAQTTYLSQYKTAFETDQSLTTTNKKSSQSVNETFKNPDNCKVTKVVRRDVVNKTIFRIIRRFFHELLAKAVPDYKHQKKNNMKKMLVSFSEFLFPDFVESTKMSEVLSSLMFRRELLLAKDPLTNDASMKVFLDIQSKYSHKLLMPALSNLCFRKMFELFLTKGMEFYKADDNVASQPLVYSAELEKLKSLFHSVHA
jgi:hypothetical protein